MTLEAKVTDLNHQLSPGEMQKSTLDKRLLSYNLLVFFELAMLRKGHGGLQKPQQREKEESKKLRGEAAVRSCEF